MNTRRLTPKLDTIIAAKRLYLEERKAKTPIEAVRALAGMQKRPQPVMSTVRTDNQVMLIAQVKYASPEAGQLVDAYDPVALARLYAQEGADAIAIFTDETIYQGGLDDLMLVSQAVNIPTISQDYIVDEYQVVEARAAGASGLILSAAVLDEPTLRSLVSATQRNLMTAIVQVHNEAELDYALTLSPRVIAISNRDPHTFNVDIQVTIRLRPRIPNHISVISMSGLRTPQDVAMVAHQGVNAVMVGEALLTSPNVRQTLREMLTGIKSIPPNAP